MISPTVLLLHQAFAEGAERLAELLKDGEGAASEPFSGPGPTASPDKAKAPSGDACLSRASWKTISWQTGAPSSDLRETLIQEQRMLCLWELKKKSSPCWKPNVEQ